MKYTYLYIFYILMVLIFFPAFAIPIPLFPGGAGLILFIAAELLFIILLSIKFKTIIKDFYNISSNSALRYFIFIMFLILCDIIITSCLGINNLLNSLKFFILRFVFCIIPFFFTLILLFAKKFSYKKFIKVFIFLFWLNLIGGFIAYFGQLFDITIINNIYDFLANMRIIVFQSILVPDDLSASNFIANGIPRLDNLYIEPSYYARFLFLFLPLVYSISSTNVKIFKDNYFDIFLKKSIIPFTWINLILTLSPIYLILSIAITVIYYFSEIIKIITKYYIQLALILIPIMLILFKIDLSETYLARIINVLSRVHSFEDFIVVEASLATRIITYINSIFVFLKYPITGVGFGNLSEHIINQFLQSNLPLTKEIEMRITASILTNCPMSYNQGFIFYFLAENGIFVTLGFMYFYYSLYNFVVKSLKTYNYTNSYDFIFFKSFKYILIGLFFLFFYDSNLMFYEMYIIFALIIAEMYRSKMELLSIRRFYEF